MPKCNRAPAVATAGTPHLNTLTSSMAHGSSAVNPMMAVLLAQADSLESQAATLRALAHQTVTGDPSTQWIDEATMLTEYGMGKNGAGTKGLLPTRIGRKNKWRRSDIEAAISAQPVTPRAHPKKCKMVDGGDELDALIASGAVRR